MMKHKKFSNVACNSDVFELYVQVVKKAIFEKIKIRVNILLEMLLRYLNLSVPSDQR